MLRAVVLTQYRRVTYGRTDGQTDGNAIASTALAKRRAVKTRMIGIARCEKSDDNVSRFDIDLGGVTRGLSGTEIA